MKTTAVTLYRDLGELGQEVEVRFVVNFYPGTPATGGGYAAPERFDAGQASEVSVVSAVARQGNLRINLTPFYQEVPDTLRDALTEKCEEEDADDGGFYADLRVKHLAEEGRYA